MFNSPTIYSKPVAKLEKGRLVKVIKCEKKWCNIRTGDYSGWIMKDDNLIGGFTDLREHLINEGKINFEGEKL